MKPLIVRLHRVHPEFGNQLAGQFGQSTLEQRREFGPRLHGTGDDPEQEDPSGHRPRSGADQEHFLHANLVGGEYERDALEQEVLLEYRTQAPGSPGAAMTSTI